MSGAETKYSVRLLVRAPGFTAVATLSLALGIGVTTAVLSLAQSVLVRPLPVLDPAQLVIANWAAEDVKGAMQINSGSARHPVTGRTLSTNYTYPAYAALREAAAGSADVFAFTFLRQANVSVEGRPIMVPGMLVSGSYFPGMRVPMAAGRGLDDGDDRPGAEPAAAISHRLWRQAFGEDRAAVGRTIRVNGHPFTVVGITQPEYFGVSDGGFFPPSEVAVPLAAQPLVSPQWTTGGGRSSQRIASCGCGSWRGWRPASTWACWSRRRCGGSRVTWPPRGARCSPTPATSSWCCCRAAGASN